MVISVRILKNKMFLKTFFLIYFFKFNFNNFFFFKKINFFFFKKINFFSNFFSKELIYNLYKNIFKFLLNSQKFYKNKFFKSKINSSKLLIYLKKYIKQNFYYNFLLNIWKLDNFLLNCLFITSKRDIFFFKNNKFIILNKLFLNSLKIVLKNFDFLEFILNNNFYIYFKKNLFLKKNNLLFFYLINKLFFNFKNFFEIDFFSLSIIILKNKFKYKTNFFCFFVFFNMWNKLLLWKK